MKFLQKTLLKLGGLVRRRRLESEMSDELHAHLDGLIERNVAAGMSRDDARAAALRTFGGVEQAKELCRDQRAFIWLEQARQDLRYAARALRRNPGFTVTAVLTLAFGIGVNAALFIVFNALVLQSLPVKNPDELVTIFGGNEKERRGILFSYPDYVDYRDTNRAFTELVAWSERRMELTDIAEAQPDPLPGAGVAMFSFVSNNYFSVLGARLALGRVFQPEENRTPKSHPVVVVSHTFWQQHLHSDPEAIGRTVTLSRQAFTVIGVTAPEFIGNSVLPRAGWIPLMMQESVDDRAAMRFGLIGRLRPEVSENQAKADLDLIARRLAETHPHKRRPTSVLLDRGMKLLPVKLSPQLVVFFSPLLLGFGMVLVIACTNVANLLLARSVTRQSEIGVRLTLGASRGRVLRQLLTENMLLCVIGAGGGLLLASWTLHGLRAVALAQAPGQLTIPLTQLSRLLNLGFDYRVGLCGMVLAGVAGIAAGLLPALHASRGDLFSTLKGDGSALGRRINPSRLRSFLVVVQVAVCLTLLSCAGALVRNLITLRRLDLGFRPEDVLSVQLTNTPNPGTYSPALRSAVETLRSLPDVASACAARGAPLDGMRFSTNVIVPGAEAGMAQPRHVNFALVSAGFFETFGISLQRGRAFTADDVARGARLAVISETTARELWPAGNALGQTFDVEESERGASVAKRPESTLYRGTYEVVGIARNVLPRATETPASFVYLPLPSGTPQLTAVFVRPRSHSVESFAAIAREADAAGVPLQFRTRLTTLLDFQTLPFTALAWLSGTLGVLALVMAAVGLYGVMAFAVNQRVREIGIRIALGATAERVIRLFLRQGLKLVAIGMIIGLGGGVMFTLAVRRLLVGLGAAFDPIALGAVTLLLAAVALLACWLPARRATKVDPILALRSE
jgi:macrolide transport system ATP-binding/permease protein